MTQPDTVAAALAEEWARMIATQEQGWSRFDGGGLAAVTGVPFPSLNGVWAHGTEPSPDTIGALLDEVAATGLPYCLQVRPAASELLGEVARGRGMELADEDMPLMALDGELTAAPPPPDLRLRQIAPEEVAIHVHLLAEGFGVPEEHFTALVPEETLELDGMRCYVGEVDGEALVTGFGLTSGDHVGIFNVATAPGARRRGFGEALTARAVADGFAAGAAWAWLQSSPSGFGIYERLGFRLVESWDLWVALP